MPRIFSANGATIAICTTQQTAEPANAAAYEALTYVNIGGPLTIGTFGDAAEEIAENLLDAGRTIRAKGVRNAGTLDMTFARDYADAGQSAILAAEADNGGAGDYAFKITFDDAPSGGTPSERYFLATVGSATETVDDPNSTIKLNANLWINTKVTRVNAAAA